MARVLVTDGDARSALAVVRSLGRAGHQVTVTASRPRSLAGSSRFAVEHIVLADSLTDPLAFGNQTVAAARERRFDFVIPISDASALSLLPRRDELLPAVIPFPSLQSFRDVSDKALVAARAASVGIRAPRQVILETPSDVDRIVASLPNSVLVIKPSRTVNERNGKLSKVGVMYARDPEEARTRISALPESADPLLLQERIVGAGIGVFLLLWEGEVLASFAHRRIREKPPSGGVSVLSESVPLDARLLQQSVDLLALFDWSGVAMVEYKLDEADGVPVLMEINGRFWGSLQLAIDSGVNFPALLVAAAAGSPTRSTEWQLGVRSQWTWGYLDSLLSRLRRPAAKLNLDPPLSRVGAVVEFLKLPFAHSDQVYQPDDRGPALRELIDRFSGKAH